MLHVPRALLNSPVGSSVKEQLEITTFEVMLEFEHKITADLYFPYLSSALRSAVYF